MTKQPAKLPSANAPRILVRGVNRLGDAVMTTPALLRLREAHPDWHITLFTRASLAGIWKSHPAIDQVLVFENNESLWTVARRLREMRFHIGLALPNSTRSALELCFARIPTRIGFGGRARRWLLTETVPRPAAFLPMRKRSRREILGLIAEHARTPATPISDSSHQIYHYLELVRRLGANAEPLPPHIAVSTDEITSFLAQWQLPPPSRPLFGLVPGAEYGPAKRWPADRFISAAAEIQARTRCQWIIFGGPSEVDLAVKISEGIRVAGNHHSTGANHVINLAGATPLRELCSGLKACKVLLTNDTGPMHVAAAVGTPVVAVFGSTSPNLTGPGQPATPEHTLLRSRVPCSPCFLRVCPIDFRCMDKITPKQVVEAVLASARL